MNSAKTNQRFKQQVSWLLKEKYNGQLTDDAKKDVVRLKKGEPLDYIIGFKEFLGCKIDLSLRPFIPRPETKHWAEKAVNDIKQSPKKSVACLDIFAGSGCLGLAILKNIEKAKVDFADIDGKCLRQVAINSRLNQIHKQRYNIIKSNIFQDVNKKYDYILANPPYIALKHKNKIDPSVLNFEPPRALFAKEDGLKYIKTFLQTAPSRLDKDGKIYLEFDSCQKPVINKILVKLGYRDFHFCQDQFKRWRYLTINKKGQ